VPDELLEMKIPRFIFQPLIENSIIHGTEHKDDALIIQITAKRLEGSENVSFTVMDDGKGMDDGKIRELNEAFTSNNQIHPASSNASSIGLGNINSRLRLHYGDDSHITIRREDGRTIICFIIA